MITAEIDYEDNPAVRVLEKLAAADAKLDFNGMVRQWRRHRSLSPRQMLLVQWRLAEHAIPHEPRCFNVDANSDKAIAQLHNLSEWQKQKLAPYLSWEQRSKFGF